MSDGVKGSFISKAGKTFWISAIIMFILLILSCIMLSTSLYEYVKSDDEASGEQEFTRMWRKWKKSEPAGVQLLLRTVTVLGNWCGSLCNNLQLT